MTIHDEVELLKKDYSSVKNNYSCGDKPLQEDLLAMKRILSLLLSAILITVWIPTMAEGYSDMLIKAQNYCSSEDYTKAIACYQLAQKLQPDQVQAFLGEADVHIILKDYDSADSLISTALEIDPVSSDAWFMKCKIDGLRYDFLAFDQDAVFAEVCGVELADINLTAASMYYYAGDYSTAASYFDMTDMALLNETQLGQYRKAVVNSRNTEIAEKIGLSLSSLRNTALDKAFDDDNLVLRKTELPAVTAEDFVFSDDIWDPLEIEEPADPIAELRMSIPDLTFTWLSFSPTGNSGFLVANESTDLCYYAGKYHILYPSRTRGVEDTYGNLEKLYSTGVKNLLDREGVIYSPDGRYAAIFNFKISRQLLGTIYDPVVLDLSTGAMILTATFEDNKFKTSRVITATFSSDGRYLYYMLKEFKDRLNVNLYRYDLQEDMTQFCYSCGDQSTAYYPHLTETRNDEFIILSDNRDRGGNGDSDGTVGITNITNRDGIWNSTECMFLDPLNISWNWLDHSINSGYAVVSESLGLGFQFAFNCIRPEDENAGLNQYYVITKRNQIQEYSAGKMRTLLKKYPETTTAFSINSFFSNESFQAIVDSVLSPDGHYVLLLTLNYGTTGDAKRSRHLFLVRLDDLEIKEVKGIDPLNIEDTNYKPIIEWNTDKLIIGTTDGIQIYEFNIK